MLVALHQPDPRGPLPPCFDRYYVGERYCVRRFLRNIPLYREQARAATGPTWLATPLMVPEQDFERVGAAALECCGDFAGVLIGDIGLGRRLAGRTPLAFGNALSNVEHALRLRRALGIELVRAYPPVLRTLWRVAEQVPAEAVVHGALPLSATPRCLTRLHLGCEQCDALRTVRQRSLRVTLRGNTLYAGEPIRAFGLIERLRASALFSLAIEGLGLETAELEALAAIYRGQNPPPDRLFSAIFDSGTQSGLDTPVWMELREEAVQNDARTEKRRR